MRKTSIAGVLTIMFSLMAVFISCEKRKSEGIAPTFGTTGNPNPGHQTVTGNTTYTTPATENTSLYVGGAGWTNPTCGSTQSVTLKGFNGTTDVTLTFATAIKSGTYAIAETPAGQNACAMTVLNAPNQPAGIIWYGKSGIVSVSTTSAAINASFNNVVCAQKSFGFPTVNVSGALSCGG